jgi:hypothetical protein
VAASVKTRHYDLIVFQSSPDPKAGCDASIQVCFGNDHRFQSPPDPKAGCDGTACGGQESHPYLSDSDKLAADYTILVRLQSYKWRLLGVPGSILVYHTIRFRTGSI